MRRKVKGWETILHTFISKYQDSAFRWGAHDCMKFANKAIKALCEIDVLERSEYRWLNKKEAVAILKKKKAKGWGTLAEKELDKHFEQINTNFAQRGDVLLVETLQGEGLGVLYKGKIAVLSPKGLVYLPLSAALKGWRID
jgi:hypothetical protein